MAEGGGGGGAGAGWASGSEFLGTVIEALAHPFMVVDAATYRVLLANRAARAQGDGAADTCHQMTHRSPTPCAGAQTCPLAEVVRTRAPVTARQVHLDAAGRERHVEVHGHPILSGEVVVGMIEYSIDVTERVVAERDRAEREARFRMLSEAAQDAIVLLDGDGRVSYWNAAAERTFGWTAAEVLGRDMHSFLAPERFREAHARAFPEFQRSGHGAAVGKTLELQALRRDGNPLPVELSLSAVQEGGKWHAIGILRDVTERRRVESGLRDALAARQAVVDTAATAVFTVDPEQRITDVNDAFVLSTGFPRDEVLGKPCSVLQGHPCMQKCGLFDPTRTVPIYRRRCTVVAKDGRQLTIIKNANLLKDAGGRVTGGVESFVDVTELTDAAARAEAASRAKSEFLANMSHEIRTPLNGILGMTGLLLDGTLPPEERGFAETVRTCSESLLGLINDILDYSKVEAGRLELEVVDFDVRATVENALDIVAIRARAKGVDLVADVPDDVPTLVRGDPGRLRQVLVNLLGNGVKFTERGSVTLEVSRGGSAPGRAALRFAVRDTGVGIPAERLGSLFQPFVQADSSVTRRFGGTGLGLAISRRLLDLMGGRVGVESRVGEGSCFWFEVPFELQAPGARPPEPAPLAALAGRRVLVVDDVEVNRRVFARQTAAWGCRSASVGDAAAALAELRAAAARGEPYDLALLDYAMPGMDGEALGAAILADPALRSVRLVMATSMADRSPAARLLAAGFAGFLVKPVRPAQLREALAAALGAERPVAPAAPAVVPSVAPLPPGQRRFRILVADDNQVNQKVALRFLERGGYRAEAVADGREALQALLSAPYDLVLMDVSMPEMDGWEATRRIRGDPAMASVSRIPVVAMTAHAMEGDRATCIGAGMDDYVAKPVDPKRLLEVVGSLLAGRGQAPSHD